MPIFYKYLSGWLAVAMFTTVNIAYLDVPKDNIHFEAIERLKEDGVLSYKEYFHPDDLINQAEFLALLMKGIEVKVKFDAKDQYFNDVPAEHWVNPYIKKALDLGLLQGRGDYFYPEKSITKAEALRMIFQAFRITIEKDLPEGFGLSDVKQNDWYAPIVYKALMMDIAQLVEPQTFEPLKKIDRAYAAQLIYNMRLVEPPQPIIEEDLYPETSTGFELSFYLQEPTAFSDLDMIWNIINQQFLYQDTIDLQKAKIAAIKSLVESLDDPYTVYFSQKENDQFQDNFKGEIVGIGAYISKEKDNIIIMSAIKGTPAYKAGLQPYDIIEEVDGQSTRLLDTYEVVDLIRRQEGTSVELKVNRNGSHLVFNIVRSKVDIPTVIFDTLTYRNNNYALIEINHFGDNTFNQFKETANNIIRNQYAGIILDLRNNPGGYLDSAVNIASFFLKEGDVITRTVDNNQETTSYQVQFEEGMTYGELSGYPVVIIQNKGSASAAEILAGALKDLIGAKIVGNASFGKGTAQVVKQFEDGSSLKMTVAKWLRPNGEDINHIGIPVDVEVSAPDTHIEYLSPISDPYIQSALDVIR